MSGSIALSEAKDARPEQMSGDWIEWVIMNIINEPLYPTDEAMATAAVLNRYLTNPRNKISKFVTAIDKKNGPANSIGKSFRFNIVNYGTYSRP